LDDLTARLGAGPAGTSIEEASDGLDTFFIAQGVLGAIQVDVVRAPSSSWMRERAQASDGVAVLLLGFYQRHGGEVKRVAGHWVAANCAESDSNTIELSDPYLDRAAEGFPGRAWGGVPAGPVAHNDTANVSYDRYAVSDGPLGCELPHYGGSNRVGLASAFAGQNWSAELEPLRGELDVYAAIYVAVDYALYVQPVPGYPVYEPSPTPSPTATATGTATLTATATTEVHWLHMPLFLK
jgi:hypothetical protein